MIPRRGSGLGASRLESAAPEMWLDAPMMLAILGLGSIGGYIESIAWPGFI
jgi:hypothetical protein